MKLWSGRFVKDTSMLTDRFNASLPFDFRMYGADIKGSKAHARMLEKSGIISSEDGAAIQSGLDSILSDIEAGRLLPDDSEDIHSFVEGELTKRIGDAGRRLHTARSRNDQVATDFRIYTIESILSLRKKLKELSKSLVSAAEKNMNTYMPGFTHMQKAQPVTLAHHISAYVEMFIRDISRFNDCMCRTSVLPLGSCALAGTPHKIDRAYTAELLGFSEVGANSMDGVSDRDFAIEFIFCCSLTMTHLSRFSEELIMWASDEYRFITLDDGYSTGSSIMPQKKNPDIAELVRGKTGRVYGDLVALLTVMKGLPLAYNKDMQEDKEALFDAADTLDICLDVFKGMFDSLTFHADRMRDSAIKGYTNATDVADYLAKRGVPFRTAHEITGKLVLKAIQKGLPLEQLDFAEYKALSPAFEKDVYEYLKLENVVASRETYGGPAPAAMQKTLENEKLRLSKLV